MAATYLNAVVAAEGWPSASHFAVAVQCASRSDRSGVVRVSQTEIADILGLSRRVVSQRFGDFCEVGILATVKSGRYFFTPTAADDMGELVADLHFVARKTKLAKGAAAEQARLTAEGVPDGFGIAYRQREDGVWPVLVPLH